MPPSQPDQLQDPQPVNDDADTAEPQATLTSTKVYGFHADREAAVTEIVTNDEHMLAFPFALELYTRVIEDGIPVGLLVRATTSDRSRALYVSIRNIGSTPASVQEALKALGEPVLRHEAPRLHKWFVEAARTTQAPTVHVTSRPHWADDRLVVPGINAMPAQGRRGYGPCANGEGDEQDARAAYRQVLPVLARNPKAALVHGAVFISADLEHLRVSPTLLHVFCDALFGKTEGCEDALRQIGDPVSGGELRGEWNQTLNAIIDRMTTASILPYMLDDTGLADESTLQEIAFAVRAGVERGRANRDGTARELRHFTLNVVSTGERRVTAASGLSGVRRRIIEIEGPLAEKEDADYIHSVFSRYPGWILKWRLESLGRPASEIDLELPQFESSLAGDLARPLAAAELGFRRLCQLLEVDVEVDWSGLHEELDTAIADDGRAWQRLHDALYEDLSRWETKYTPFAPVTESYGLNNAGGEGRRWAVFPSRAKQIGESIGIPDIQPVMKSLRDEGLLVPDPDGSHLTKRMLLASGDRQRMYVLVKPDLGGPSEWATTETSDISTNEEPF